MKLSFSDLDDGAFINAFNALLALKSLPLLDAWALVDVKGVLVDKSKELTEKRKIIITQYITEDELKKLPQNTTYADILTSEQLVQFAEDNEKLSGIQFDIPLSVPVCLKTPGLSPGDMSILLGKIISK